MQKRVHNLILGLLLLFANSCAYLPTTSPNANFMGHIYEQKFNKMPMMDKPNSKGSPLHTTLYIYEPTNLSQLNRGNAFALNPNMTYSISAKLIDSAVSDKTGAFQLHLSPGKYSIFVKYNDGYFIPFFSGTNWASMIEIKENEINSLDIQVQGIDSAE
jgi:hypothetical protein